MEWAISLSGLFLSVATIIATFLVLRNKTSRSRMEDLERRVVYLEKEVIECNKRGEVLISEKKGLVTELEGLEKRVRSLLFENYELLRYQNDLLKLKEK